MKKTFLTVFVGACLFGMITSCGQQPVEEKSLSSLAITKNPDKVEYNVGDAFSLSGLEVTATYSDESKEAVTNYTTSLENGYVFTINDVGTKKINVSYTYGEDQTKTVSFSVRVSRVYEKVLSSITITTPPTKVEYEEGEELDLTGLQVTASFENGATETLGKDNVTVTGYDKNTVGEQTLTVSYTYENVTKTATFKVTVKAKTPAPEPVVTLKNIKIETEPNKVEYKVGEKFSSEGLTIRANYSDDSYKIISEGFTLSPITDGATLNRAQRQLAITVTYQSKTASFNISVKTEEVTITGIEVTANPTKVEYEVGEKFSSSGLKVVAKKSDGTTEEVTNYQLSIAEEYEFTETDIGENKDVTVTYYNLTDAFTATFKITVKAATPEPGPGPEPGPQPTTKYTISFDSNGGSGSMAAVEKEENEKYALPACTFTAPSGKQFKAWLVGNDQTERAVGYEITVTTNVIIKAVWEETIVPPTPAQKHTISFNANSGTGTMNDVEIDDGETYTLPACGFTAPSGKVFKAWQIGNDATERAVGYQFEVNGDVTITAIWDDEVVPPTPSQKYTVSFSANLGTGTMEDVKVDEGGTYALPTCTFTAPVGQQFKAWQVGNDATERAVGYEITVNGDVTITAIWEAIPATKYTVSFDANGGIGEMDSQEVEEGEQFTLPANEFTAPAEKQFSGWKIGEIIKAVGDKITINDDTVVKAVWNDIPKFAVTFDPGEGSGEMDSALVIKGGTYTLPVCTFIQPEHKHFGGWQVGAEVKAPGDEITVGSNIAVTAVWDFDPKVLQSIAVKTNPKTSYQVGEQFDSAGLVVTVTYDYGDPVDIDTGFTLSYSANYEFKADDIGEDKTVTVSYAEGLINVNTTYKIDVYVAAGYYIEYEGDAKAPVKMATENLTDNQNTAEAINLSVENGDEFEIVYYDGSSSTGNTKITALGTTYGYASYNENAVTFNHVDDDGYRTGTTFNLYFKVDGNNGTLYLADVKYNSDTYNGHFITYSDEHYEFKESNKMAATQGSNKAEITLSLEAGDIFKVEDFTGSRGIIETKEKNTTYEYPHYMSYNNVNNTFTVQIDGDYKVMISNGNDKVYIENVTDGINNESGYYIVYGPNYDVAANTSVKMGAPEKSGQLALSSLNIASGKNIKVVYFDAVTDDTTTNNTQAATAIYLDTDADSDILTFNSTNDYIITLGDNHKISTEIDDYYTLSLDAGPWTTDDLSANKFIFFSRPVDNDHWNTTPKIYCFKDGGQHYDWPGDTMKDYGVTNEAGEHIYCYLVDTTKYDKVVISNGSDEYKTQDIYLPNYDDCANFYFDGGQGGSVGVSYDLSEPRSPHIYAWVWADGQGGRYVAMTDTDGDGIYEAKVHANEKNVIFGRFPFVPTNSSDLQDNTQYWLWNRTAGDLVTPTVPVRGSQYTYKINEDWSEGGWQ